MVGEWSTGILADLCESVDYGYTASAATDPSVGPKFLRITDIRQDGLRWDDVPHVEIPADKFEKYSLHAGDIVVARTGAFTGANAYVVPPVPAVFASYLVRLKAGPRLDPRFAYYFMQSGAYRDHVAGVLGGSAQPNASAKALTKVEIPVPPLPEQRRIAAILGALDDKIELNRKMNRTLEEVAQALFKSWFIDFDGHDDLVDSEIGLVPRGWGVKPIGDVVKVVGGSTPSTKEAAYWDGGTHAWATPKDLSGLAVPVLLGTERQITDAGLQTISSGLLPAGTFLLSSRAPIGYTAISKVPTAINQGFIAIPPGGALSAAYLLFWTRYNMDAIKGRAGGTTFAEISKSAFRPIPVVVPPPPRLAEFERSVGPLMERITANAREADTLATLRDTLLPRLISGELRVPEAETLVEAVS